MTELLSQISAFLPIFLASPSVYAGVLLILSSQHYPRGRAFAAWAGSALIAIVIGILAVSAGNAATDPRQPSALSGAINLVLGAVLFFFGIWRLVRMPKKKSSQEEKTGARAPSPEPHLLKYMSIGILLTVTNGTSLASYLAAAKLTVDSGLERVEQAIAMAVAALYYTLPLLWPLLLALVAPQASSRFLLAADRIIKRYGRYIMGVILILLGIYLAKKGLDILGNFR